MHNPHNLLLGNLTNAQLKELHRKVVALKHPGGFHDDRDTKSTERLLTVKN